MADTEDSADEMITVDSMLRGSDGNLSDMARTSDLEKENKRSVRPADPKPNGDPPPLMLWGVDEE